MFNKGDVVVHVDYGTGVVWSIRPSEVLKYRDKNENPIHIKGTIEIAFDSEMGEYDDNGRQKTLTILPDGRENPIGSGYHWNGSFNQFDDSIKVTKL